VPIGHRRINAAGRRGRRRSRSTHSATPSRNAPTPGHSVAGRQATSIRWRLVVNGVFDAATTGGVIFRAVTGLEANAIAQVQAQLRRRLLRVFVRRGLLPGDDARAMGQWQHGGGFSVDGSVRVEATDRTGRERRLRYCARPPFALDRLRELDREQLIYDPAKPGPGGSGPQCLTPLELLDRLAALVPPPRLHRHRDFGVLAPNSPLRSAVTALAPAATTAPPAPNAQSAAEPAQVSAHRALAVQVHQNRVR